MVEFIFSGVFVYLLLALNAWITVQIHETRTIEPGFIARRLIRWIIVFHAFNLTLARVPSVLWRRWIVR